MTISEVQHIVDEYLEHYPEEASNLQSLQERLDIDEIFNNRKSFIGHGTAGAIILSPDKEKMLLIHHAFLDKWLQPGGHWDPEDPNPWTVAKREAYEETGQEGLELLPVLVGKPHVPIDISSHDIPAREEKAEPAHVHHDFRYVFIAQHDTLVPQEGEVTEACWIPLEEVAVYAPDMSQVVAKVRTLVK